MTDRYLAFVKDHEEGKKHPDYVLREHLGFPNQAIAEKMLFKFFRDNQHYLYAWQSFLDPNEDAQVKKVVQHFYNNFGPYYDNLLGTENFFENLKEVSKGSLISSIKGTTTAFIVGAGPSLDLTIDALAKVHKEKQGLIIACDAAYKKLLAAGIRPEIVVSTERIKEVNYFFEDLKKEDCEGTIMLWNGIAYPEAIRNYPGEKAFFYRDAGEYLWLDLPKECYLTATPYTTYASMALAVRLKMTSIILVAQDFAYGPNGESHANLPVNQAFKGAGEGNSLMTVVGVSDDAHGQEVKMVQTTSILNMFAQETEFLIEENPGTTFYNVSPIGRRIKGTKEVNLSGLFYRENPSPKIEVLTKAFPLSLKGTIKKAIKAYHEFESNKTIKPSSIETFKHLSTLAYHYLIHGYVLYQSMVYQRSEDEVQQYTIFNQTYGRAREDFMRILDKFIKESQ